MSGMSSPRPRWPEPTWGFLAQTAFSSGMVQFASARLREPAGGSQLSPPAVVNRRPLVSVSDPQSRG